MYTMMVYIIYYILETSGHPRFNRTIPLTDTQMLEVLLSYLCLVYLCVILQEAKSLTSQTTTIKLCGATDSFSIVITTYKNFKYI